MTKTVARFPSVLLLVGLMAAPLLPAHATTALSALDILDQFNVVTYGDLTTASDIEGRTVVGGNLAGGGTFYNNPGANLATSSYSALTVYGSVTSTGNMNINNSGGLTVGGSNSGSFSINGSGTAYVGGANTGGISFSTGTSSVTVGSNAGSLSVASGSVFVNTTNSGSIKVNSGTGSATVLGNNAGTVSIAGGNIYLGSNNGAGIPNAGVTTSSNAAVAINGNSSLPISMNGGGTLQINGSSSGGINMSGGSLTYTGSLSGSNNLNGGAQSNHVGSLSLTPPANTAASAAAASTLGSFNSTFWTPLTQLSTQLAGLTANSTVSGASGQLNFNAAPNSSGLAVFNVNSSIFSGNYSTVALNLDGATTVIINVSVDGCTTSSNCVLSMPSGLNFLNPTGYAETVLWNFVNATGLAFSTQFGGTVLAPNAAVTANANIDGTVVAASLSAPGAEIHSYPFSGTLPDGTVTSTGTSTAAPEPASMAVIGSGMAALGWVRRRRRGKGRRAGS